MIGLFCAVTATSAVVSVYTRNEYLALYGVVAVVATLVLSRVFGHQELHLLGQRVRNLTRSLVPTRGQRPQPTPTYSRMQGSREWDDLWQTLIAFAERFDLSSIQMNLTMPMIAEEYHADWNRKQRPNEAELWHSDIPLKVHDVFVGRLRITGASKQGSVCAWMGELIVGLKPFETQLLEMISDHVGSRLKFSNQDTIEIPAEVVELAAREADMSQHPREPLRT
jgi:UDP-GlcNAc:undecaprenyl-phosphate GlcNAc-1-phosphate transferase